jgi:hypothetical protein
LISPPYAVPWNGKLYVFHVGTDRGIWMRAYDGKQWDEEWETIGGELISPPYAVPWNGKLYVFHVGTDRGIWMRAYDGKQWDEEWETIGGEVF